MHSSTGQVKINGRNAKQRNRDRFPGRYYESTALLVGEGGLCLGPQHAYQRMSRVAFVSLFKVQQQPSFSLKRCCQAEDHSSAASPRVGVLALTTSQAPANSHRSSELKTIFLHPPRHMTMCGSWGRRYT